MLTLFRALESFWQIINLNSTTRFPCVIRWIPPTDHGPTWKRTKGLKNTRKRKERRKKIKRNKKKIKKKGDLIYESSLGEIRLTTSPCIRSRHAPSKIVLDRGRKTYQLSKYKFSCLKCKETINLNLVKIKLICINQISV